MSVNLKLKPVKIAISILMLFSLLAPCASVAAAQEDEISTMAAVIDSYSLGLTISGITAKCTSRLASSYSTTLRITMELQKKNSSGGYDNVQTWTDSTYGVLLTMSESRAINVLSDYRLKVTFTAGTESRVAYDYS